MFEKPTPEQLEHRFLHHPPFGDQADRYARIRKECARLAILIVDLTPVSREQALSLNALDQAMFLANASIARNEEEHKPKAQAKGGTRKTQPAPTPPQAEEAPAEPAAAGTN